MLVLWVDGWRGAGGKRVGAGALIPFHSVGKLLIRLFPINNCIQNSKEFKTTNNVEKVYCLHYKAGFKKPRKIAKKQTVPVASNV